MRHSADRHWTEVFKFNVDVDTLQIMEGHHIVFIQDLDDTLQMNSKTCSLFDPSQ